MRVEYVNRKYRDQLQNIDVNHVPGDFGRCALANAANPNGLERSPGEGQMLTDPYTGEVYMDTDPGDGDERLNRVLVIARQPRLGIDVERDAVWLARAVARHKQQKVEWHRQAYGMARGLLG